MAIWAYREQLLWNIVHWLMVGVSGLGLAARLYVRVHLRGSLRHLVSYHWSDILLIMTWVGFFVGAVLQLVCFAHYGYVSSTWDGLAAGQEKYFIVRKILFAWTTLFWVLLFIVKGSLLCFYDELVDRWSHPKTWWVIRITGVIVGLSTIVVLVYGITWCEPIHHQWAEGKAYCWAAFSAKYKNTMFRQVTHVGTDVIIMVIPVTLIPKLRNVPTGKRIGVAIMFLLGLFCTICSIVYLSGNLQNWDDLNYDQVAMETRFLEFEPIVELGAAILIQCVPAMRVFWRRYHRAKKNEIHEAPGENHHHRRKRPDTLDVITDHSLMSGVGMDKTCRVDSNGESVVMLKHDTNVKGDDISGSGALPVVDIPVTGKDSEYVESLGMVQLPEKTHISYAEK